MLYPAVQRSEDYDQNRNLAESFPEHFSKRLRECFHALLISHIV